MNREIQGDDGGEDDDKNTEASILWIANSTSGVHHCLGSWTRDTRYEAPKRRRPCSPGETA